ncbi:CG30156, partial [Drosophila busckii]
IGLGMTAEGYLKSAVNELTRGNYEVSMGIINKGMDACQEEQQVMALLELKSIIARLRLQCNTAQKLLLLGPTSKSNALPNTFSLEMLDVVQKVLRCRNHYEMLRISHHASYSEVKRAYKRLALRLHPDKNRSPGAAEAFRRINEAADTLTDQQKRIAYNMLTAVGDCFGRQQEQSEQEIETELQTESEHQPSRVYQPANQRQPQRQALYQTEQLIIGLTAAVIFILITVQYLTASSVYSLTPSSTHNVRLISQTRRVPYFVEPEFLEQQTSEQLRQLEHEIEQLYLTDLRQSCKQERKIRES